jgi:transcriptional regulator with XRE-family HTH domain
MGDALTDGIETRKEALVRRLGALAKQRREELGSARAALAKEAGIESDKTIRDFEFGRSLPPEDTRRKLEAALGWRLEIIDDVIRMTGRAADTLAMGELDAEDSYDLASRGGGTSLAAASDADLLAEVARRMRSGATN